MANYPDWVLKHKKKGTYINYQNGKYYLYAAHSERVPGTDKVRRVSDGYLGRITEEGGFIPAKRKLSEPVYVYEYGLSKVILSLCGKVRTGLVREFRDSGDYVMACGALLFMYGEIRKEQYESSWLSVQLSGFDAQKIPTDKQRVGMERVQRMIADILTRHFGDDCQAAVSLLPLVKVVRMGTEAVIATIPGSAGDFFKLHGFKFEEVENG
jgi:hypothetical protein